MAKKILKNGYRTILTFALNANIKIAIKTTKMPGISMGGKINTSTMDNNVVQTAASRVLKEITNAQVKCAYDSDVYNDIMAIAGLNGLVTATLPNGAHFDFYGFIDSFEPSDNQDGQQPEATIVVIAGNEDANGDESLPSYTTAPAPQTTTTPAPVTTTTAAPAP